MKIVKRKSITTIKPNTKYISCTFYIKDIHNQNFATAEFENCSFRGSYNCLGKDKYGMWMSFDYKGVKQNFRWIIPGVFTRTNDDGIDEEDGYEEQKVTLTKGFWLAETACTQTLWQEVMGSNPSYFKGKNIPVESVSWDDCNEFIDKLNKQIPHINMCLPTEAQWEYACRSNTNSMYSFGNDVSKKQVHYNSQQTLNVKSLPCNEWGLYEMHGNVKEWCYDWHDDYDTSVAVVDPVTVVEGSSLHVIHGGSWNQDSYYSQTGQRDYERSLYSSNEVGFRLCIDRDITQK